MGKKYKDVRSGDIYVRTSGELRVAEESQLDRIDTLVSALSQTVESVQIQLNDKVDKDKIISSINISDESVLIKGNKVHLNSDTLIDHGTFSNE